MLTHLANVFRAPPCRYQWSIGSDIQVGFGIVNVPLIYLVHVYNVAHVAYIAYINIYIYTNYIYIYSTIYIYIAHYRGVYGYEPPTNIFLGPAHPWLPKMSGRTSTLLLTCTKTTTPAVEFGLGASPLWIWSFDGKQDLVGGLEHLLFSPIVGMVIQSDFHIFQGGWNHQLVMI